MTTSTFALFLLVTFSLSLNQVCNGQGVEGINQKFEFLFYYKLSNSIFFIVLPIRPKYVFNSNDQVTTLLNKPYSPATYASMSSYIYQLYGEQAVIDIESAQACRLNSNPCHKNSECCSKYCRCTRWNSIGKEVCWRRCL